MRCSFAKSKAFVAASLLVAASSAAGQSTVPAALPDLTATLQNLSNSDFAMREAAQNALRKIPAEEFGQLQDLADRQADPEIKARLMARVSEMAVELVRRPAPPVQAPFQLGLRLVNPAGQPIAGASIDIGIGARQYTDANGRANFGVALDDNPYTLTIGAPGYDLRPRRIIKKPGPGVMDVVLQPSDTPPVMVKGVVVDDQGKPVPHEKLQLSSMYDREYFTATGAQGEFSIGIFAGDNEHVMPQLHYHDLVAPLDALNRNNKAGVITLLQPGTLAGKVLDRATSQPLAGITVTARYYDSIRASAKTDADGHYNIMGLAPSRLYRIEVDDAAYFARLPRGDVSSRPFYVLDSGKTTSVPDFVVEHAAIFMGRVLDPDGRPAAGARVGVLADSNGDGPQGHMRYVHTDADGRYVLSSGHPGADLKIEVGSATGGNVDVRIPAVAPGEVRRLADVQLPGTVRIRGIVVDPDGKPIKNVVGIFGDGGLENSETGDDGAFDFGRMSLSTGADQPVMRFRAPRPAISDVPHPTMAEFMTPEYFGGWKSGDPTHNANYFVDVTSRDKAPQFFQHARLPVTRPADGSTEINLKVTLQQAHLLELTGSVVDAKGNPAANANVCLLVNGAGETTWQDYMKFMERTEGMSETMPPVDVRRVSVHAGADGRWHIFALREDVQNGFAAPLVTLGARLGNQAAFLADQPIGDKETLEFKLQMHDTPANGAGH